MHCVSTCFDDRERLQKRYKLLLHCAPGYKPTQNNQETHSLRGLQTARQGAGRGRTGCQHHPYPVFDHSHRQQHPARHTLNGVPAGWCGRARGRDRGFLVLNRPICKEHS